MKKSTIIISAMAAAVMTATAYGQSSATGETTSFNSLDANRDGRISQTEAAMHSELSAAFATADSNGDGSLSPAEFSKWAGQSSGKDGSSSSDSSDASPSTPRSDATPSDSTR